MFDWQPKIPAQRHLNEDRMMRSILLPSLTKGEEISISEDVINFAIFPLRSRFCLPLLKMRESIRKEIKDFP